MSYVFNPFTGTFDLVNDSGATGANTELSNLTSPTAVNQDLIFNKSANTFIKSKGLTVSDPTGATSDALTIQSGKADNNSQKTGIVTVTSGEADDASGNLVLTTGGASNTSGDVKIETGEIFGLSGLSGSILLSTGKSGYASGGTSGNIVLNTFSPTDPANRGKIQFKNSASDVGYVWTATDIAGSGEWKPAASGGANTALSNLSTTAINADLLFDKTTSALIIGKSLTIADPIGATSPTLTVKSGNASTNNQISGKMTVASGNADSTSGGLDLVTGTSGTVSGDINIKTGDNYNSLTYSGNVLISTGDVGSNPNSTSGNIVLYTSSTPTNPSKRGKIKFQNGSEGTAGYVWTSTDSVGSGAWQAVSAPSNTWNKQKFTLSGTDITNQYIDLAQVAKASSVQFVVFGLVQGEGDDYTVNLTGGAGGKTRLTFAGPLATGGATPLVAGNVLYIQYQY